MAEDRYALREFVADLKRITADNPDERAILSQVRPLARHLNHTGRSQFDPERKSEKLLVVKTQ